MKKHLYILLICCFSCQLFSQKNKIDIKAILQPSKDVLKLQQKIIFFNNSDSILKTIYLHNWPNSFKNRKTPLSKRFVKDFKKELYFAEESEKGESNIKNLTVNNESVVFNDVKNQIDILKINLNNPLKPNDSLKIEVTYDIKIPDAKFTNYGKTTGGYSLRYWYLSPAVYDNGWQLMSNLNLDDLLESYTNFVIDIDVPNKFVLESNLTQLEINQEDKTKYILTSKHNKDVILSISKKKEFKIYSVDGINIKTNVVSENLSDSLVKSYFSRELNFLQKFLGKFPQKELFLDQVTRSKNPVIGLSKLPKIVRPFQENMIWDIETFKTISLKYLLNTTNINLRTDYWFIDGLQNYLLIEYINTYYPNEKLLGKFSKYWPIRSFNLAKLNINDKYPLVYQYTSRRFLDQALTTSADSLSNFNRKIVNKYKAGLGFRYLKGYLGESTLNDAIKEFYKKEKNKLTSNKKFEEILTNTTSQDISWFFNDFLKTSKKIDYTISNVEKEKDSLKVTIKNNRNITTPVSLYGVKNKQIKFKKWVTGIDSSKTIKIFKGDFNKLALNYENLYPEHNTLDNWKSLEKKIFNKPLKFSLIKDVQDPYYNQLFYMPNVSYNFYNGLILGVTVHNKPLIKRNLEFSLAPSYGTKSGTLAGRFSVLYNQFYEKTRIYRIGYGLAGVNLDYAPGLSYTSLAPYVNVVFKRKSLRDTGLEAIRARLIHINKEVAPNQIQTDEDKYSVFSLQYVNNKLDMINEFGYSFGTEFSKDFSKGFVDIRFRALTSKNRQLDFRIYAGAFFNNNTTSDYFSFGLDRANDYLFQLNYFGRSEDSGIFSQQFIIAEGGFKSVLPTRFANQWMLSFNSSIGLWRWVEFYNDVAFLKNRNQSLYFAYNNGIRFNFVHRILEVYFPLYSNNGWEVGQPNYNEKIRFTLTGDLRAIFNFVRRGFL